MGKELSRVPRTLSEAYNSELIERLYESGGSVALDLIVYLSNYQMKDLFGENWFSIADFCTTMGYDRTKLHRKLSEKQIYDLFGKRSPYYIGTDSEGREIKHKIETVFEAAIYRLGIENLAFPVQNMDGSTTYKFVQIITRFNIKTDFQTKKGTKRLYSATLNNIIKDSLFTRYNLVELQDYRELPDRTGYRYFYLNLAKMVYLIKFKKSQGEAPYFNLSVDKLAKIFDIQIKENSDRKKKVTSTLNKINKYLTVTKFQYSYHKGPNDKWAYTVQFFFPEDTLNYFDEKFNAVFTKRFYESLLFKYVEITFPKLAVGTGSRAEKCKEIKENQDLYNIFTEWIHSDSALSTKEIVYKETFNQTFGKSPEDLGLELFNFASSL